MQPNQAASDASSALGPYDDMVETLADLFRTYRHQSHRLYAAWGVAGHAVPILAALEVRDGLRLSELACALSVDPSVISRQSAELVREGLLERHADPDDGRATLLSLTQDGRTVLHRLRAKRLDWIAATMTDWSPADLSTLTTLLRRLQAAAATVPGGPVPESTGGTA